MPFSTDQILARLAEPNAFLIVRELDDRGIALAPFLLVLYQQLGLKIWPHVAELFPETNLHIS